MRMQGLSDFIAAGKQFNSTRVYNGFTWEERIAVNPIQRPARYRNNPLTCCVTGFSRPDDPKGSGYMFTHLEDYRRPLDWLPISKRTHAKLHARFRDPRPWFDIVADHYVHGAWFTLLVMSPLQCARPFDLCYPQGLPGVGETWEGVADQMGLSAELFRSKDLRDPIRALWKWPKPAAPGFVMPRPRKRLQPVAPVQLPLDI